MEAYSFYMEMDSNDLNSASSDQFSDCFFKPNTINPNWETSDPFESALSSMVSSPATATNSGAGDGVVIRELIGRLGNICNNSGEASNNNSCYNTPLNSPPKLNLSAPKLPLSGGLLPPAMAVPASFAGDPGFAERAAKNSLFGAAQFGLREPEFGPRPDSGRAAGLAIRPAAPEKRGGRGAVAEMDSREGSSVSDQIPMESDGNAKKRKASQRASKAKEASHSPKVKDVVANANKDAAEKNEESNAKKTKKDGNESGDGNEKQTKESSKAAEPPKDYIHVRARRGQATDSHSLAERVRREKISERMKFLQDLVPGCNKVTGKAVMLDEIINYVQSLQRQVEFLSMKLATVNPRMDINIEALLSKDIFQSRGSLPHGIYPLDSSLQTFPFGYQNHHHHQAQNLPQLHNTIANDQTQFPLNPSNAQPMHRTPTIQLPAIDGFPESTQQVPTFFEDDLQSLVQMGFGQIQQSFQGSLASTQMKVEL